LTILAFLLTDVLADVRAAVLLLLFHSHQAEPRAQLSLASRSASQNLKISPQDLILYSAKVSRLSLSLKLKKRGNFLKCNIQIVRGAVWPFVVQFVYVCNAGAGQRLEASRGGISRM
jgi:hypothetical protein